MPRVLKYINAFIALVVVAFLAALYWFGWRVLPQTSGAAQVRVQAAATIVRDARGVRHITAASIEDALFLQGYAMAQDRMWQMDSLRRLASGELAEIVGAGAVESDREARKLRLRRLAEAHAATLPAADRVWMSAFARGVNQWLDDNRARLPVEFQALAYSPRPWIVADSIVIGMHMYRTLSTTWPDKIEKAGMLAAGDKAKVHLLYPDLPGGDVQPGSNAWAIAGARTATGKPILASDPHLEWTFPSTWWQVDMKAPGFHVTGMCLPGAPGVLIGHNERIAWGVTNLHYDVQELYMERLDPATGRYLYKGQLEQAARERERIAVKGRQPVEFTQWVTRHGPVIVEQPGTALALRWTAAELRSYEFPWVELNRAANWAEFRAALKRYSGPAQNFVYADIDGNIGYQATGLMPVRDPAKFGDHGGVPVDGASGDFEWNGFRPWETLPSYYNPAGGIVVTANQNPWPASEPAAATPGVWSTPYRSRQIHAILAKRKGWKPEHMLRIQTDIYSAFSHFLAERTVAAYTKRGAKNASLAGPAKMLKDWDGHMRASAPAPLLVSLIYQRLRRAVAESATPGKGSVYSSQLAPSAVEHLLSARPTGWFDDWDAMLLRCFSESVDEGKRIQGEDMARWRYGLYNEVTVAHRVLSPLADQILPGYVQGLLASLLGVRTKVGPYEMGGSSTTVKQTTKRIGPSMRFVASVGRWDESLANVTVGQSGHFLSRNFTDQWKAFTSGTSFPMPFVNVTPKDTLTLTPSR